jgi:lysophospholipase L1-like esterase
MVTFLVSLVALSCSGGGGRSSPTEPPGGQGARRYLALGDSYTIGEGVGASERWPVQLAGLLRQQGISVGDPQIIAQTGWTVAELAAGIDAAAPRGPFDLVTLLIGVNDQYRGGDAEAYRPQFAAMLARAVALAGGSARRVVVLSIPDWGVTPFARESGRNPAQISAEIDRFNAVNREETARAGAHYVDVTPSSSRAGSEPSLLAADGLHYSGSMYAEWAHLALADAAEAIATPAAAVAKAPAQPAGADVAPTAAPEAERPRSEREKTPRGEKP